MLFRSVIVKDVKDCYTALGIVHHIWSPIGSEFDDYIAHPKGNDYRSLHTAVHCPDGRALEVQIRTPDMHKHAELGVAAHWRYKEGSQATPEDRTMRRSPGFGNCLPGGTSPSIRRTGSDTTRKRPSTTRSTS